MEGGRRPAEGSRNPAEGDENPAEGSRNLAEVRVLVPQAGAESPAVWVARRQKARTPMMVELKRVKNKKAKPRMKGRVRPVRLNLPTSEAKKPLRENRPKTTMVATTRMTVMTRTEI